MTPEQEYPYIGLAEVDARKLLWQNSMINKIDISLIGHFGNVVTVEVKTVHGNLFGQYSATCCVGKVLQVLYDLLDLTEEDGRMLSSVYKVPCRILRDGHGQLVGLGHFLKDKFVIDKELFKFCKEEQK